MSADDAIFGPKHDRMQTHAVNGAAATVLAQIAKVPFQAASILILPRLLSPDDYGIYYAVVPLISIVLTMHGMGLHQAIIQSPTFNRGQAAALFWISTITGVLGGLFFLLGAPLISSLLASFSNASAYEDPRAIALTAAASFFVVWAGVMNIPRAIMNRQMKFGWLAVIDAAGVGCGLIAGILAARAGAHHWALALDYAVTCMVGLIGVWLLVGWLPTDKPDFSDVWRFFKFGGGLMAAELLTTASRWGDNVVVGARMDAGQLGLYGQGNRLANTPLERIYLLFERLLLPLLSRMHENAERYRRAYLRIIRQLMLFFAPGTVAVGVTAPVLIPFLLGEDWAAAAPVFAWLTLVALHQPVSMTMPFLFVSQRRASANFVWSVFSILTTLGAVMIGVRWGAVGAAAAFALSDVFLRLPFLWWIVTRKGPIKLGDLYGAAWPFAVASGAVFVVTSALMRLPYPNDFLLLAACALAAYATALATLSLFKGGRMAMADTASLFRTETRRLIFRRKESA
ncbi:MAG: oligosaccharide flippase family protein [Hydrogenophilaceae bacterium]|jgi:PST family polysaccharide transporter|nr:oligosaccharide flippase family protein [Hydrogenophilaceae bacterium]